MGAGVHAVSAGCWLMNKNSVLVPGRRVQPSLALLSEVGADTASAAVDQATVMFFVVDVVLPLSMQVFDDVWSIALPAGTGSGRQPGTGCHEVRLLLCGRAMFNVQQQQQQQQHHVRVHTRRLTRFSGCAHAAAASLGRPPLRHAPTRTRCTSWCASAWNWTLPGAPACRRFYSGSTTCWRNSSELRRQPDCLAEAT